MMSYCNECVWSSDIQPMGETTATGGSESPSTAQSPGHSDQGDPTGNMTARGDLSRKSQMAADGNGSEAVCMVIGIFFWLAAAYLLLLSPGLGDTVSGREVVNLQKLFLGSTCGIAGAIFIAAAIRPR